MAKPSSIATPSTDVNGTISPDSVTGRQYNNHIKTLEDVYKRQASFLRIACGIALSGFPGNKLTAE